MMNNAGSGKLFAKHVPVTIKDIYSNKLKICRLFLTVEWNETSYEIYKQVLVISLTDSDDPFFLYNLHLSEEDFQMLKTSQGLLVDFSAFPQKFIDLIEACRQEESKAQPKFMLTMNINENGRSIASPSQLDIVETNDLKPLMHLSLKLVAATESDIKQYSAACFKNLKEENCLLQNKVSFLEQDRKACQESLNKKIEEIETMKKKYFDELKITESKLTRDIQEERNNFIEKLREKDCKVQELENRVSCLDAMNTRLHETNSKYESTIREIRSHNSHLEKEVSRLKGNIQSCRKQIEELKKEIGEKKSHLCHQKDEINELESKLNHEKHNATMLQEQIDKAQREKSLLEAELKNVKMQLEMVENTEASLKEDINKGNNIIIKLQKQIQNGHEKIKSYNNLLTKQEQIIVEKDKRIQKLKKEISDVKINLDAKIDEVKNSNDTVNLLQEKVKMHEKELKNRDNVIKYLNRQLTDHYIFPQYAPPAKLSPSAAVSQVSNEKKLNLSEPTIVSKSSPMSADSVNSTSKSPNIKSTSQEKNVSSPQVHFQNPETVEPALSSASSRNNDKIIRCNERTNFEIDSAALSAAFGSSDNIVKHSTAKKQTNQFKKSPKVQRSKK